MQRGMVSVNKYDMVINSVMVLVKKSDMVTNKPVNKVVANRCGDSE